MEIIQWLTGGATKPNIQLNRDEATKHCLIRLDSMDRDLLDSLTVKYIQNENAKDVAEYGGHPSLSLRISEDDLDIYKIKCLEAFALLIGLIKPGEDIVDWIHKF